MITANRGLCGQDWFIPVGGGIGCAFDIGFWEDPDFDANQSAVYCVRVLKIPKPRWSACNQQRFGVKMPDNLPMTVKDRAYTSPVRYTP